MIYKKIRKIEVLLREIIWTIGRTIKPISNDITIYNNIEYIIKPYFTEPNIWKLYSMDGIYQFCIHDSELKISYTLKRFVYVFRLYMRLQADNYRLANCSNPIGTKIKSE